MRDFGDCCGHPDRRFYLANIFADSITAASCVIVTASLSREVYKGNVFVAEKVSAQLWLLLSLPPTHAHLAIHCAHILTLVVKKLDELITL